jgi:hypothetical protein
MRPFRIGTILLLAWLGAGLCTADAAHAAAPVKFYDDIKPILSINCYKCHGPLVAKGDLRLDLRQGALGKAKSGSAAIVRGDSRRSEMFRRISSHDPDQMMPKKAERLSEGQIEQVRRWIEQGAPWPDKDDYWAFQPPTQPTAPLMAGAAPANPIDAFIDAPLQEQKITPVPRADARTLLRRAYGDLLGVPPTPAEAREFLSDGSPDAFAKLIDRLLADPRYGERWARHWLDLVRYSESDGFEDDKIRPRAWRYRDYVIRSLNADKPYDRFVQEQIAGDELFADDPDAWIAVGFARLGMWDGMSKDPPRQRQDFLNDATDAVGSVFLGVTIGCARCHDHKYDAIKQSDYYALQAFFANITRANHDLSGQLHDPPHVVQAWRKAQSELAALHAQRDTILAEGRSLVEWEHRCEVDQNAKVLITEKQIADAAERLHRGRISQLDAAIKQWEQAERLNGPVAEAVLETSAKPPTVFLLEGGELSRPGPQVQPHFIEAMTQNDNDSAVVPPAIGKSSGRRAALARWLTSPENPLIARVMVNRLWQHHVGRGIVATPSDFGRHGQPPTHPELLDWLACRFMSDGWSIKRMHRLIMTSAVYQRASTFDHEAALHDPQNILLWRANRHRLDAEAIRDSMLAVSGQLSDVRGGPGVYPRISKDVNVELPNNDKELSWGASTDEEGRRRSIYIFQRRSLSFPLVEVFDGATMSQTCPVRAQTTVAPQALALLNGEFCREQAKQLTQRVAREAGEEIDARIRRVFVLALTRQPSAEEFSATRAYLQRQAEVRRQLQHSRLEDADAAAFADFCQVILNTNEFMFLD